MTPDDRLNQLEPLLSEALTVLDRHTAQLRQHTGLLNQLLAATGQLTTIAGQHSDTLGFILREQAEMKAQMQSNQEEVNEKLNLILDKLGKLDE